MAFKQRRKKFVTFETVGLRLTNKEAEKARNRYSKFESSIKKRFKHIRSQEHLPKIDEV
jgi:hypothetical protein